MNLKLDSPEQVNSVKIELIQANLETAVALAKLALQSDDEIEITRLRRNACEAYEEALHYLRTVSLTHIELESFKTKMARLEPLLLESGQTL